MTQQRICRSGKEWTLRVHSPQHAEVWVQTVDPETARRSNPRPVQQFTGDRAQVKALGVWMRAAQLIGA